jgi:hypothetical protein
MVKGDVNSSYFNFISFVVKETIVNKYQRCPWGRGSGRTFFQDIEKVREFDRVSVFTSKIL